MCGIVGLIDTQNPEVPLHFIEIMQNVMIQRGPDGEGHFIESSIAMGMRRLSIIDLDKGWQPLFSKGHSIVAFQNGEIYNYQTLRKELIHYGFEFKTNSDTEVLAHGYACWGIEKLLEKIDGMYAIAILDRQSSELHIARDRFGEKPLFYCFSEGRFAYSSDLTSLAALPWANSEIDLFSVDRYLALHYIPGDRTIFQGIKRVLPGERLQISLNCPHPHRYQYYQISLDFPEKVSDRELTDLLQKAVNSRLIADVPVGIFLSGGLDSSIVAALASHSGQSINTFSMGFKYNQYDESQFAQEVAHHIGSHHHHFTFDERNFQELLPKVAVALDEPIGDQATLPLYWLCEEASRHVKVVLSGEGADEIFAGYGYYRDFISRKSLKQRLKNLLKPSQKAGVPWQSFIRNSQPITPSGFPLLCDLASRQQFLNRSFTELDNWEGSILDWLNRSANRLQQSTSADIVSWLSDDLLIKYDRMAMAHSIEGRAPFLQPELVNVAVNLPESQRMDHQSSKIILRRIAKQWLPPSILQRRKQGFVLPMESWLREWIESNGGVKSYFQGLEALGIDSDYAITFFNSSLTGNFQERLIFSLILLFEWYKYSCKKLEKIQSLYIASTPK